MGFFDKVTKAVSETVDRGKKEVDQFMRIQKVKGEISAEEQRIRDAGARAQQVKQQMGEMVIARLRAGTLADPELQTQADRVAAIDREVETHEALIAEKRAEIARIEAEGTMPAAVAPAPAPASPVTGAPSPSAPPPLPGAPSPAGPVGAVPPPLPPAPAAAPPAPPLLGAVTTACSQCGATIAATAAFCTECGAKLA